MLNRGTCLAACSTLSLDFHWFCITQSLARPSSSLRMAGGFETKEAAAARIAKQQASHQKSSDSIQQQQQQPAKAPAQQQFAQAEELSSRPAPPPAEEPFKNPVGSRADEILRRAVSTRAFHHTYALRCVVLLYTFYCRVSMLHLALCGLCRAWKAGKRSWRGMLKQLRMSHQRYSFHVVLYTHRCKSII
jgi:hypothetical protein